MPFRAILGPFGAALARCPSGLLRAPRIQGTSGHRPRRRIWRRPHREPQIAASCPPWAHRRLAMRRLPHKAPDPAALLTAHQAGLMTAVTEMHRHGRDRDCPIPGSPMLYCRQHLGGEIPGSTSTVQPDLSPALLHGLWTNLPKHKRRNHMDLPATERVAYGPRPGKIARLPTG